MSLLRSGCALGKRPASHCCRWNLFLQDVIPWPGPFGEGKQGCKSGDSSEGRLAVSLARGSSLTLAFLGRSLRDGREGEGTARWGGRRHQVCAEGEHQNSEATEASIPKEPTLV